MAKRRFFKKNSALQKVAKQEPAVLKFRIRLEKVLEKTKSLVSSIKKESAI